MKCQNCGAEISGNTRYCEFCGSQITLEMKQEQEQLNKSGCPQCGSGNITFRRENQGEVRGKNAKQVIHRTVGVCKDCGATWFSDEEKKKRKTWLWVLGWIFIFPVPLTIIMLRKKDLKPAIKYTIIAVAWVVYLIIAISGRGANSENNISYEPSTTISVEEVVSEALTEEIATTADNTTESESETTSETSELTGIRPEFKAQMDDYEAFFDEYIAFMDKYTNTDDNSGLFSDYIDFMTKYSKAMESLEALGEEEMSEEETAYYVEVSARISGKLAKYAYLQN